MSPKRLIERFYHEVWNRADEVVAREILHPEFCFRGSLGEEKRGPDGFIFSAWHPPAGRFHGSGAAFFAIDGDKITNLWVLGDIDSVKQQLGLG